MQNVNSWAALSEEQSEIPALGIMCKIRPLGTGNFRYLPVVDDFWRGPANRVVCRLWIIHQGTVNTIPDVHT